MNYFRMMVHVWTIVIEHMSAVPMSIITLSVLPTPRFTRRFGLL